MELDSNNFMSKPELLTDETTLNEHSRDVSVFQIVPRAVCYPKSALDIQSILAEHPEETFTVRVGGTCMSGGSLTDGMVFNMSKYMNAIKIDPEKMIAEVECGAMLKSVLDQAAEFELMFAPYPSSRDICGVGGVIGNNASGEKSIRLGATIDNILGLEVVLADGTIIRTGAMESTGESMGSMIRQASLKHELIKLRQKAGEELVERIGNVRKSASGYRLEKFDGSDLTPLFVGAQGTLGIATRALLKLVPIPKHLKLVVISIDAISELPFILKTVTRYNPEAVETFDINTFTYAKSQMPIDTAFCDRFFAGGNVGLVVLVELSEETEELTEARALDLCSILVQSGIRVETVGDKLIYQAIWNVRRHSFAIMRDCNIAGHHAVPCIEDVIVPISEFDKFIPALITILESYGIKYGFHGHIGEGSLRIVPVIDFQRSKEEVSSEIINLSREVFILIESLHGNISADHSDGIIRSPFVKEFYGDRIYGIFVQVKDLFDPKCKLNKGKKVRAGFDSIKKYLVD